VPDIGFFAYPGGRQAVREAIPGAAELSAAGPVTLTPWESMHVIGFKIDDLVRETISEAAVVFADITYPNPNVIYEMGFAIAKDKPTIPTLNKSIDRASQSVQAVGLFDSIGYLQYVNANDLWDRAKAWRETPWPANYARRKNHSQPLLILDTYYKTDFRNHNHVE
jgi:hypothetical protein